MVLLLQTPFLPVYPIGNYKLRIIKGVDARYACQEEQYVELWKQINRSRAP